MKVRFKKTSVYKQIKPEDCRTYLEGEVYDLEADHAGRWISRGVAVEVKEEAVKPVPVVSEPPPEKPKKSK